MHRQTSSIPGTPRLYSKGNNLSQSNLVSPVANARQGVATPRLATPSRPMTSNSSAGYKPLVEAFDSRSGLSQTSTSALLSDESLELRVRSLENQISACILSSCELRDKRQYQPAGEKAKEAARLESQLRRLQQENSIDGDHINPEIAFSVNFNLAVQDQASGNAAEAIDTFTKKIITSDRQYSTRFRANLGNIQLAAGQYTNAIKSFKMARDAVPASSSFERLCITRNIGHVFLETGKFTDAIEHYEQLFKSPAFDHSTALNLLVCYYMLKDQDKLKAGFTRLITIPLPSDPDNPGLTVDRPSIVADDALAEMVQKKLRAAARIILTAASLVAPKIAETPQAGFDWLIETLRSQGLNYLASEVELGKASYYLKSKNFQASSAVLRNFEKREPTQQARAATNLSFLNYCEGDFQAAESFADLAVKEDKYSAPALVNKGNCLVMRGELDEAKETYLEACGVSSDCLEGLYNLGLVCKQVGMYRDALSAFEKLRVICSSGKSGAIDSDVLWQLADVHARSGNAGKAKELLIFLVNGDRESDPGVLAKLAGLFASEGDELQAYHYYSESLKYWSGNIDVLGWLGVYHLNQDMYERAIPLFARAAELEPTDQKWLMLVASCHKRVGNAQRALEVYEEVTEAHPDDVDCLRCLVTIAREVGSEKVDIYAGRLARAERVHGDLEISTPVKLVTRQADDSKWGELPDIGI